MSEATLLALLDTENAEGLVALVEGAAFRTAVEKLPSELLAKTEEELRELARPTYVDYALRNALWNEVRIAQANFTKVQPGRVFAGICSRQHYSQNVLGNPAKLAWLLQPVKVYEESLEPLLVVTVERFYEILRLDIRDERGRVQPAVARLVLEAGKAVEARLRGTPVQQVESRSVNVRLDAERSRMTEAEIDARIAELEAQGPASARGDKYPNRG